MRLLLKKGIVTDCRKKKEFCDVLIEDGVIKGIDKNIEVMDAEIVDVEGKYIMPGFIDVHTHLREPGYEHKETIKTGTMAAAKGGFTEILCMPNTNPVIDNRLMVEYVRFKAEKEGLVKVHPVGAITKGLKGEEISEIGEMVVAGIKAISDDGNPVMSAGIMKRALTYAKMFGIPVISHCEDKTLSGDGVINGGLISTVTGLKGIPASAEEVMVARDVILANEVKGKLHIAHVSTKGSVELIRRAKEKGIKVTCEVTPHHLFLTEKEAEGYNTLAKVNPPLRSEEDVESLKNALKEGIIDIIATDHAPHSYDDKNTDFTSAAFGISGLETAFSVLVTALIHTGILTVEELVEKLSRNPGKLIGEDRGVLEIGRPADLVIADMDCEIIVDVSRFLSKGKNTPLHGRKLKGKILATLLEGRFVYRDF